MQKQEMVHLPVTRLIRNVFSQNLCWLCKHTSFTPLYLCTVKQCNLNYQWDSRRVSKWSTQRRHTKQSAHLACLCFHLLCKNLTFTYRALQLKTRNGKSFETDFLLPTLLMHMESVTVMHKRNRTKIAELVSMSKWELDLMAKSSYFFLCLSSFKARWWFEDRHSRRI